MAKSMIEIEGDRRDLCTYFCSVVFPFIARLADPHSVVMPRGLGKLKDLHTLGVVNIAHGNTILQDIKTLTRLRKLAVSGINKKNCQEFCCTLAHLSHLESLSVKSWDESGLRGCLDDLHSPPKSLQSLKLVGALGKLPEWVAGLQNLVKLKLTDTELTEVDGTMQVLGKLPNLAILRFLFRSLQAEELCCLTLHQEAFPSLTVLDVRDELGIGSVVFEERTAPNVELLHSSWRILLE